MKKEKNSDRVNMLKKLISIKETALVNAPEGSLRISRSHATEQYYHLTCEHGTLKNEYLSKEELPLISALAQKSYDLAVLRLAQKELQALELLEKTAPPMRVEDVYDALPPVRRNLVTPIRPSSEELRAEWEAVAYSGGYFRGDSPVYLTDRGERVRSKSEQLIANLLYRLGIPYRYEYPVQLLVDGKVKTWRPDFMLLDVRSGKEYYLEHFGMLDDSSDGNYARNAFWKMKVYEQNGMYEGETMLYSFETSRAPLDIQFLELRLRRIFGLEPSVGD